jgi:hypothetical protein
VLNPKCKEIFSKPDVDGGIGGAALKADDFVAVWHCYLENILPDNYKAMILINHRIFYFT